MLVPMWMAATGGDTGWLQRGPLGMAWLSPDGLFGLTGWSRLGRAVGASLFFGTLATILVATVRVAPDRLATRGSDLRTLRSAGRRFLPARSVDGLLADAPATGPVSSEEHPSELQSLMLIPYPVC